MTNLTEKAPLGRMLAIFIGIWLLANIVLAAIGYAFPDLPVPSSVGIVLAMVAAMSAGQSGAKAVGRSLVFGEKAVFSVLATALSVALGIAVLWGIFAWFGVPFTFENVVLGMTGDATLSARLFEVLVWIIPVVLLVYWWTIYLGAAWGSRNQIKLQEKLAAKGR